MDMQITLEGGVTRA